MLIETYHHVAAAPKHIATAVSVATEPRHRDLLSQYFSEEYNHAPLFLTTLERLGVDPGHVKTSHPTIGTISLTHMLCEIARAGSFDYLTATALFEAQADEVEESESAMRDMARRYGFDPTALEPVLEHMRLDVVAGHAGLLAEALDGQQYVFAADAHRAVNWLHDLKHAFDQVHDGIVQYYSDIANYIPRLSVDYFSL